MTAGNRTFLEVDRRMKLYSYFHSSAAWRVRIVLALKGLDFDLVPVHLLRGGGEHRMASYIGTNPQGLVPALEVGDGDGAKVLTQSLAIMEYLEETCPQPCLLPGDAGRRAEIRAFCQGIACEIHPLNNLRVLKYLVHDLGLDEEAKLAWYHHWITDGFRPVERLLEREAGPFCFGAEPTLADACLVPQVYNAKRFKADLSAFPKICAVNEACLAHEAFAATVPALQPDAE
jgi:maleylacetoacetate isomerase